MPGAAQDALVSSPPVLIVGAGPAGLFAASELMRHGVKARIVEQRTAPHHETRGTAIQPAVLEVLHRGGLVDEFLKAGVHVHEIELLGPGLQTLGLTALGDLGCKYPFQSSQPQWLTETILRKTLASHGLEVEYGVALKAVEQEGDELEVTLERDGVSEVVAASYLLGAGGAHDITRETMHETLEGETYSGRFIVADAAVALRCPPARSRVVLGPEGFVLFAPLPEGRWIIFVNRDEADVSAEAPDAKTLAALINRRLGMDAGLANLRWVSYFRMQRRVAPRLGDGRRFLLGDAGHLSSPMGGEGINSALMDAADIAWKLALVLKGAAKPSLLDTYAIERGLADQHVLDVSNEIHSLVMQLVATCASGGDLTLPVQEPAERLLGLRRRSMFDVSYAGSPIVAGDGDVKPAPGEWFPALLPDGGTAHQLVVFGEAAGLEAVKRRWGTLLSVTRGEEAGLSATNAGVPSGGAVLVRPDGFIGFRTAPADDAGMRALDRHLASYLNRDFAPA